MQHKYWFEVMCLPHRSNKFHRHRTNHGYFTRADAMGIYARLKFVFNVCHPQELHEGLCSQIDVGLIKCR